jgi:hypothetical protein
VRVTLAAEEGVRGVRIGDLIPLEARWTVDGGTQPYDPVLFDES